MLAPSPDCFRSHRSSVPILTVYNAPRPELLEGRPFSITNIGLSKDLMLILVAVNTYMAFLGYCHYTYDREAYTGRAANLQAHEKSQEGAFNQLLATTPVMFLQRIHESTRWGRIRWNEQSYTKIRGRVVQWSHGQIVFEQPPLHGDGHCTYHPILQKLCTIVDCEPNFPL